MPAGIRPDGTLIFFPPMTVAEREDHKTNTEAVWSD